MKVGINVVTCRAKMMRTFMASLHHMPAEWGVYVLAQTYEPEDLRWLSAHPRVAKVYAAPLTPPFIGRTFLMEDNTDVDVWVYCDDDMELLGRTDFETLVRLAVQPGNGLVQGDHRRSIRRSIDLTRYNAKLLAEWPIPGVGGGLACARPGQRAFLALPRLPYTWDDVGMAAAVYAAGLRNYVYFGSLALHKCGTPGGHLTHIQPKAWVGLPPGLCDNLKIGWKMPLYYTREEHQRHNAARVAQGWDLSEQEREREMS